MAVQRYDSGGKLGKVKRTAQGGIEVPARLRRTGVLEYVNADGTVRREYVPPEELFNEKSLATLHNAPVTNLHPVGMVDVETYRNVAVGHLTGEPRKDGRFVEGDLVVQDSRTIGLVESGERNEVSLGYLCAYEPTPGVSPEGERYDGVQRNIIYNHVALVQRGRAGREVALRLDSEGNQMTPSGEKESIVKIELIDGVEYEVGSPAHTKAKADADKVRADAADALVAAKAERDQYKAELEAAKARFDSEVDERVKLIRLAESKGVEAEGTNLEIRAAILSKLSPSLKFDSADEVYVKAALDVALASGNLTEAAKAAVDPELPQEREDAEEGMSPDSLARENMIRRLNGRPMVDRFGKIAG